MRNRVDLGEARPLHLPGIGLERGGMLQPGPQLGAALEPMPQPPLGRGQAVIDGASADPQPLTLERRGEPEAPANPGHPLGPQRFPPHHPG